MKPKLLAALSPSEPSQALLSELRQTGTLDIECLASTREVASRITNASYPAGVLAQLDRQVPGFLELLATSDRSPRSVSVLGTAHEDLLRTLPASSSKGLILLDLDRPPAEVAQRIVVSVTPVESNGARACRQGIDYLVAAISCRRSVSLALRSVSGLEVATEIVGGDVWNAYAENRDPIGALAAILFESIEETEIRALNTIPGERHIELSGTEVLGSTIRSRNNESGLPNRAATTAPPVTQELDLDRLAADLAAADIPDVSEESPDSSQTASTDDCFEALLASGIEASLSRDYARAGKAFKEALALKPDDPRARHNLARIRLHL